MPDITSTGHQGQIKFWKNDRGFGFVTETDENGLECDRYFHAFDIVGNRQAFVRYARVSFDLGPSNRGIGSPKRDARRG